MDIRTYRAASLQEALDLVRRDLGPDASVLHAREAPGGWLRWMTGKEIEVVASNTVEVPSRLPPSPSRNRIEQSEPRERIEPAEETDYRSRFRRDLSRADESPGLEELDGKLTPAAGLPPAVAELVTWLTSAGWSHAAASDLARRAETLLTRRERKND